MSVQPEGRGPSEYDGSNSQDVPVVLVPDFTRLPLLNWLPGPFQLLFITSTSQRCMIRRVVSVSETITVSTRSMLTR
jgi:hypothetical protein